MKILNKLKRLHFLKSSGIVAILLLAGTVGALSAISTNSSNRQLISLIVSTRNNPFFASLISAAEMEANNNPEIELRVFDSLDTDEQQVRNVDLAISLGSDAVIINPVNSQTAAASGAQRLVDNDIPIIAVDRSVEGIDVNVTIASDNQAGARNLATHFRDNVLTPASVSLRNNSVFQLQGVSGSQASIDRGRGFGEIFGDNLGGVQRADFNRANANTLTSAFLTTDSARNTKVIFAENDEMALGALTAIQSSGNFNPTSGPWTNFNDGLVYILGFDGTTDALNAIREGTMFSTVIQQPDLMGRLAVQQFVEFFRTNTFAQSTIAAPTIVVDRNNVSDFI